MQSACQQTIPLLKQMLDHQSDAEKMNHLFVEVDRICAKVGTTRSPSKWSPSSTRSANMRRHHADLMVKTAKKEGRLHQPGTPETPTPRRDIDYVSDLQTGCERLLEIIEEATAASNGKSPLLEQGRIGRREVAGA